MDRPDLIARLDLTAAVQQELTSRNRLLPPRYDYAVLAERVEDVERWMRAHLRRGPVRAPAEVVFASKGWRGARPLSTMALEDRVLYRALVDHIASMLPSRLVNRAPFTEFREAPLSEDDARYVTKTDVTAYYEYVDHETLADELIAQTGEEDAVLALTDLLKTIMGRRVGLPQVHVASDVLGDTYIDPIRRKLRRRGVETYTYADDFRLVSPSLGHARRAVEMCSSEMRELGLVLNERKTYTYGMQKYRESLSSFAEAEERLFVDDAHQPSELSLLIWTDYGSTTPDEDFAETALMLGASPLKGEIDEDEAIQGEPEPQLDSDADMEFRTRAALRAWELWLAEEQSEDAQSVLDASIAQSLLGRALPMLGLAAINEPLRSMDLILRYEPALTPQVAEYMVNYSGTGKQARTEVRDALDDLVQNEILGDWQAIWIAHTAGSLRGSRRTRTHVDWLVRCVNDGPDPLAATAAASLGRLDKGTSAEIAAALERLGTGWRQLALWGLMQLDTGAALDAAEHELDRILLTAQSD